MAKRVGLLIASAVTVVFMLPSCSDDGAGDDDGNNANGTGGSPNNGEIRDLDGDGQLDPIRATEFGDAGVPISEADVTAMETAACTGWTAEPEPMGANLFLVVDASSSMDATANGTGDQSKWVVTRDALVNTVQNFPDDTMIGLLGYPNKVVDGAPSEDHSSCVNLDELVPVGRLGENDFRQTVINGLNDIETETCTPTHDAYVVAVENYAQSGAIGQKYILLMTDGTPTLSLGCQPGDCTSSVAAGSIEQILAEIQAARDQNIKTFVLGSPGSELHMDTGEDNRPWLSQAAEIGGTATADCSHDGPNYCHFDMTQAADFDTALNEALATIAGRVVSCDYGLPTPEDPADTIDVNAINLVLRPDGADPVQLLRAPSSDCAHGWYYDSDTERVSLCPDSCAVAQSDPRLSLMLMFGCTSDQIIR